jgi:hypothetical protein
MNIQTWNTINAYYQALWTDFSSEKLQKIFDDNIELQHNDRKKFSKGKENAINIFNENFFESCLLDSTKIFDFGIEFMAERISI